MKIFISSVQKEFAAERKALAGYLSGDMLLRRFFETFLFERDVPASDRRLEVWNPGSLPPPLTPETLRGPHASVPHNPLLAEPMYLSKYIERMGTGIRDMIRRCRKVGLPEPEIRIDGGSFVLTVRRSAIKSGPGRDPVPTQSPTQSPTQLTG